MSDIAAVAAGGPPHGATAWLRDRVRRVRVLVSVFYALMTEYRGEIALWAVATALPLIMLGVWSQAAESGDFTLSRLEVVRYFVAVFVVRQFTVAWVVHDFEWHVISGRLSPMLLRPMDPWQPFFLIHAGEQLCRLPFVALLAGVAVLLYPEAFVASSADPDGWRPELGRAGLAVVATYLAFCVRWWMQYLLCVGAFWLERITAADALLYLPYIFLSGLVFPMSELQAVVPGWLYEAVLFTPFPWMAWFPASLLLEPGTPAAEPPILRGFATLLAWLAVFVVAHRFAWRVGVRRYSAMGA